MLDLQKQKPSKAGLDVCDVMAGQPMQTANQNTHPDFNGYSNIKQRARLLSPQLENIRLDYSPNETLTHRSTVGRIAARRTIEAIEAGNAKPDDLYLALKSIICSDLPAATLAELRTFARLVQMTIEEVSA